MLKMRIFLGCMILLALSLNAQANLVAWWPLSDGSGQIVGDASGNGNSGFLGDSNADATNDPAWVFDADRNRNVLEWDPDGSDATLQYVNLDASLGSFAGLTEGTMMAWVKVYRCNTNNVDVILAASDNSVNGSDIRFHCNYRTSGTTTQNTDSFNFMVRNNGASAGEVRSVTPETPYAPAGEEAWHHLAVTYTDSANGTDPGSVRLFLDGAEISQYRSGINTSNGFFDGVSNLNTMSIGRSVRYYNGLQSLWVFDGRISDVAVYDSVLTDAQIALVASDQATPLQVPEPVTLVLLSLGGAAVLRRRNK